MLTALGSKPGARALAAFASVVLVADVFVAVAKGGGGDKEPDAVPTVVASSKAPSVKPTATKKPTKKPVATQRPPVARRSAGCGNPADFNGDGYADLAVAIPHKDADGLRDSGAVQILYGGGSGLKPKGVQVFTQDSFGSLTHSQRNDLWGIALATGDFNGDKLSDLAVGAPLKQLGDIQEAGQVTIIYGTRTGLTAKKAQAWTQNSPGIEEESQLKDHFGQALAAGDFNRDGFADLAIGVPFEDVVNPGHIGSQGPQGSAGVINVILGSSAGLTSKANKIVDQNFLKLSDTSNAEDLFAYTLAAGDFDGDTFCDVAAGVPGQRVGGKSSAGAVNVVRGGAGGLIAAGAQFWTQDSPGVADQAEDTDQYGSALSVGDFDGDGRADIAIGLFLEDLGSKQDAGAVSVLYGGPRALASSGNQFITLDTKGIKGGPAVTSNEFGFAVQAGDFNGDKRADLAVGVPYKTFTSGSTTLQGAGEIVVIPGSSGGLRAASSAAWSQDSAGVADQTEADDLFGYALASGDFNRDGRADVCVGAPDEGFSAEETNVGAINVLYGGSSGVTSKGNQFYYEGHGISGTPGQNDAFGSPLRS